MPLEIIWSLNGTHWRLVDIEALTLFQLITTYKLEFLFCKWMVQNILIDIWITSQAGVWGVCPLQIEKIRFLNVILIPKQCLASLSPPIIFFNSNLKPCCFFSLYFVFLLYRFFFFSLDFVFLLYRFRWNLFSFRFVSQFTSNQSRATQTI